MAAGTLPRPHEVHVASLATQRLHALLQPAEIAELEESVARARQLLAGRVIWNINSTATGGGVAEMLQSLLAYTRGAGVDARWIVIGGDEAFFEVTKRLHNYLHGDAGDGGPLAKRQQRAYRATIDRNAAELGALVRSQDIVILHDPQTAGLIAPLKATGATVVWRSHVGAERVNEYVQRGWEFLRPFVAAADAYVFSRHAYVPAELHGERAAIIAPSIDPLSPKNQDLDDATVAAILRHVGLIGGQAPDAEPMFHRMDDSPARVDRRCEVLRESSPPGIDTPLVVQVSRWDRLKDPLGVMRGFAEHVVAQTDAHLILAGPAVDSVTDDPEGLEVLMQCQAAWRELPRMARSRVHLACLPMDDVGENAAIVNALQRHAAVVVQKSLQEGFGLTVTEGMWKARPMIASAVGGVLDQIEDRRTGLLLADAADLASFGHLVLEVLNNHELAARLGRQARLHVRQNFLANRHLGQYVGLLQRLLAATASRDQTFKEQSLERVLPPP